jgi:hypothetical protein
VTQSDSVRVTTENRILIGGRCSEIPRRGHRPLGEQPEPERTLRAAGPMAPDVSLKCARARGGKRRPPLGTPPHWHQARSPARAMGRAGPRQSLGGMAATSWGRPGAPRRRAAGGCVSGGRGKHGAGRAPSDGSLRRAHRPLTSARPVARGPEATAGPTERALRRRNCFKTGTKCRCMYRTPEGTNARSG